MASNKRIFSKRKLEISLDKLETLKSPKLKLEQYPISAGAASELLYMAGFEHDDLRERIVDLGTGTGRLAIGAALLNARDIIGVDIDKESIRTAERNAKKSGVEVDWVIGNLESVHGDFHTVLMNPPYGTRSPHLDTLFLTRAFQLAPVTYSLHKSSTREFLIEFAKRNGRSIDQIRGLQMRIPHLFQFHRKSWETISVDLCRITSSVSEFSKLDPS